MWEGLLIASTGINQIYRDSKQAPSSSPVRGAGDVVSLRRKRNLFVFHTTRRGRGKNQIVQTIGSHANQFPNAIVTKKRQPRQSDDVFHLGKPPANRTFSPQGFYAHVAQLLQNCLQAIAAKILRSSVTGNTYSC